MVVVVDNGVVDVGYYGVVVVCGVGAVLPVLHFFCMYIWCCCSRCTCVYYHVCIVMLLLSMVSSMMLIHIVVLFGCFLIRVVAGVSYIGVVCCRCWCLGDCVRGVLWC